VPHGALTRRYPADRFELGDGRSLIVSRGVGCGLLPVRWNAPAAILVGTIAQQPSREASYFSQRSSQPSTVSCHRTLLAGFSTQWFSSGK